MTYGADQVVRDCFVAGYPWSRNRDWQWALVLCSSILRSEVWLGRGLNRYLA